MHASQGLAESLFHAIIATMDETPSPLRLRKKHGRGERQDVSAADGERIVAAQSFRNAVTASLIAIIVFCLAWIAITEVTGRVYPWATVILGYLIGTGVRLAGRGVDWPFPLLAACMTLAGSIVANVVLAASVTADSLGTGTLTILQAVTSMTWPVFFAEVLNIGDAFFAVFAAGLAAFYANRRLNRREFMALRLWREAESRE